MGGTAAGTQCYTQVPKEWGICQCQDRVGCYYLRSKRSVVCLQSQARDCVNVRGQTMGCVVNGLTVEPERWTPQENRIAFETDLVGRRSEVWQKIA